MAESDETFLERLSETPCGSWYLTDHDRLFALARRGAEMNDAVKCHKEPEHQDRRYNVAERIFGDD